jgi:hypothetical protein
MKQYQCVQVGHHNDIGKVIEEYQKNGWHLHTYQATTTLASLVAPVVSHYLLFEKDAE